jgi:hypothetical protein
VGESEDNAELVDDVDLLRLDDVYGGDGFQVGKPVMILVAGRMSLFTWPFKVFPFNCIRYTTRIAPTSSTST